MTSLPASRAPRLPRIALGGILHETHSFASGLTLLPAFAERALLRGEEVRAAQGSASVLGGARAGAGERAEVVPALFASAMPGPRVDDAAFSSLASDLIARVRQANRGYPGLAGVVLLLHGAMITTMDEDPEGTLLAQVRAVVGARCPIVAVIDSHATVTPRMVATADLLLAYRTYPHIDLYDRGMEAMEACLRLARAGARPLVAHRRLPLLMPLLAQATDEGGPLAPLVERAAGWRARPGIASVSLVPGFPFADVPDAGASILVYADHDPALANRAADDLAHLWWDLRHAFDLAGRPPEALLDVTAHGPLVVADIADNPGAGAPSDATHLLRFFMGHGLREAAFACIVDPAAVAACHEAGLGATRGFGIGGNSGPLCGEPVVARWRIDHLGDGLVTHEGPMGRGGITRLGRTATVSAGGISVILSERRAQVLDPAVFRAGGITPDGCRWLVVKSSVHYRAAFRTRATTMIDIETPGLAASTLDALPYNRVRRPIWPLDRDTARA